MAFPKYADIEVPLLKEIEAAGGQAKPKQLYSKVAAYFTQLTSADLSAKFKHGEDKWETMVAWARETLCKKGELSRELVGIWTITDKGRERLKREWPGGVPLTPAPTAKSPTATRTATPNRHEQLKKALVDIGSQLGYHTEVEKSAVYRHDVTWQENPYTEPSYVIEVCEGGSLPKDFDALHWAIETWRKGRAILVVTDDRDFVKATNRFAGQPRVVVVKAETIQNMHKVAQDSPEFLRLILGK